MLDSVLVVPGLGFERTRAVLVMVPTAERFIPHPGPNNVCVCAERPGSECMPHGVVRRMAVRGGGPADRHFPGGSIANYKNCQIRK